MNKKDYKVLFNTLYTPLCLFANKYLDSLDDSKDIVQEVFLKLWKKKIVIGDEAAMKSYLYTSVKNKSIDFLKSSYNKKKNLSVQIDFKDLESDAFLAREIIISEASDIIEKAMKTLPKKSGKVVRLAMQGLSNEQIAEDLSISINTVKTQKKLAYRKLRELLKKDIFLILIHPNL
ncbi:RNA polymerase sigma-70 factor, ECF subfamily [Arenibacter nanhaiticus]|uniref:RNA polymerase sigma-70 factor, ECF subfamily n=1 Tax=Arenibacter nanhaiticus TaxID=558155 RepID=A0A1M6GX06_9FLAO|nr:RNA polymerase sigma-70 factor [Arenibacter nanhaiticus]SHJ14437.1 RNA polymerase sigma-70 factor, ECF subfamily [Arenibacter nanhaiticus]